MEWVGIEVLARPFVGGSVWENYISGTLATRESNGKDMTWWVTGACFISTFFYTPKYIFITKLKNKGGFYVDFK